MTEEEIAKVTAEKAAIQAEFSAQLKDLTGHETVAEAKAAKAKAEADHLAEQGRYKELAAAAEKRAAETQARYELTAIRSAIAGASGAAIDPEDILSRLASRAKVAEDGAVQIDGKPVAEVVAAVLKASPHLAKPAAGKGSGAGGGGGEPDNKTLTMAQMGELRIKDHSAYVVELKRRASGGSK